MREGRANYPHDMISDPYTREHPMQPAGERKAQPLANGWLWNLICATGIGLVLRAYRLDTQFPIGDEWHAITIATHHGFVEILSSFFSGAHSIPEALYYRALASVGALTERAIYAPFVLIGTAAISLVPCLTSEVIGRRAAAILAWLIALAPLLIFYSRFARPYGIVAILSMIAVWNFERWIKTRSARHLLGYGLAGAFAAYFHVIALPFVVTPIAIMLLGDLFSRRGMAISSRDAARASVSVGLPTVALLGAPAWNSYGGVTDKVGHGNLTIASAFDGYSVLLGGRELPILLIGSALALLGVWALLRDERSRWFAALLLAASAVQVGVVVAAQPLAVEGPHIFARYVIPAQIALLVFIAAGAAHAMKGVPQSMGRAVAATMLVLYFAASSAWILTRYNTQTGLYILASLIAGRPFEQTEYRAWAGRDSSPFYEALARQKPGQVTLVEGPFHIDDYSLVLPQIVHRQRVLGGFSGALCDSSGDMEKLVFDTFRHTQLRNVVDLGDDHSLRQKSVDYVVLHGDAAKRKTELSGCVEHFTRMYGTPVFEDADLVAFAIKKPDLARADGKLQ
jgi:hypothetical protein